MANTPLATVLETRDVLQEMSDAGDILLIVERQQLVFHVVPQPSRLGWYADVYARAMTGQPWGRRVDALSTLTPIVTIFGLDLGGVLGGAILTESVFSLPGLGKLSIDAVFQQDLPIVMGCTLFAAFFIVFANFLVDLLYAVIDPRIRLES